MKILIKNTRVLVNNKDTYEVKEADIYITGDKIANICYKNECGNAIDNTGYYVIDGKDKLVMPGLINSHTHSYMSLLRNCADDTGFDKWLFETVEPMENKMVSEDGYWGTLLGNIEMIKSGTTSYVDMHMFPGQCVRAARDSGMRVVLTRGLVGENPEDEGGIRRLREAKQEMKEWGDNDMFNFMLAPHAPYSCGRDYLRYIAKEAEELNIGIHIHLSESKGEVDGIRKKTGLTPIEYIESTGIFKNHCIAAHCVYLTGNDVRILKDNNISVVTNPASNMKLANGFAPLPALFDKGINVCLGTDGAASNNSLNMFREMSLVVLVHKGITNNPKLVTAQQILHAATTNGAKAMGIPDVGEIAIGKKADLVIINLKSASLVPWNNIVSSLVYSATGSEVETVIINGCIIMEKKELKTIDEERVYFEAERIAAGIRKGICN